MADTRSTADTPRGPGARGYEPEVPIAVSPILDWPPQPAATLEPSLTSSGLFVVVLTP